MLRATVAFLFLVSGCALRFNIPVEPQVKQGEFGPRWLQLLSPVSGRKTKEPLATPAAGKNAMFCMVPKVACTEFLAMMMRLHGFEDKLWNPVSDDQPMVMVHFEEKRSEMFTTRSNLETIMKPTNNDYVRAVFLRDPVERFVSAYLDKIKDDGINKTRVAPPGGYPVRKHRGLPAYHPPKYQQKGLRELYPANSSSEMVEMLEIEKIRMKKADPHFRSQVSLCRMNDAGIHYDFIGSFNALNEDAHKMVSMFGAKSELLDNGWGPGKNQSLLGTSRSQRDHGDRTATHAKDHVADISHSFAKSDVEATISLAASKGVDLAQLYVSMGTNPLFFSYRNLMAHIKLSLEIRQDSQLVDRIRKLYAEDHELWMKANA